MPKGVPSPFCTSCASNLQTPLFLYTVHTPCNIHCFALLTLHAVQISFHDTSKMPSRPPVLSDPWGLTLAALGMSGALHASPSTLVYRCVYGGGGQGGLTLYPPTQQAI